MASAGQQQSAELQRLSAQHQQDLFNIGKPGLQIALGDFIKDLGAPGEEPAAVRKAFSEARDLQDRQFGTQAEALPITAEQQAKQSGFRGSGGTIERGASEALYQLEGERRRAQNVLLQQETDAAVSQRDFDLSQILGLAEGGISSSFGYNQNALNAAGMNMRNPWQGAAAGALSGAASGAASGGWVGAIAGGILGGAGGYFGGN